MGQLLCAKGSAVGSRHLSSFIHWKALQSRWHLSPHFRGSETEAQSARREKAVGIGWEGLQGPCSYQHRQSPTLSPGCQELIFYLKEKKTAICKGPFRSSVCKEDLPGENLLNFPENVYFYPLAQESRGPEGSDSGGQGSPGAPGARTLSEWRRATGPSRDLVFTPSSKPVVSTGDRQCFTVCGETRRRLALLSGLLGSPGKVPLSLSIAGALFSRAHPRDGRGESPSQSGHPCGSLSYRPSPDSQASTPTFPSDMELAVPICL